MNYNNLGGTTSSTFKIGKNGKILKNTTDKLNVVETDGVTLASLNANDVYIKDESITKKLNRYVQATGTGSAMIATIANFVLEDFSTIQVRLSVDLLDSATLSINGSAAYPIYTLDGSPVGEIAKSGSILSLSFNSSLARWYLLGGGGNTANAKYTLLFDDSTSWADGSPNTITILGSAHKITQDIEVDLMFYDGSSYMKSFGEYTPKSYNVTVNNTTKNIVISSYNKFSGKIVIRSTGEDIVVPMGSSMEAGIVQIGEGLSVASGVVELDTHALTHALGGSDPITPESIGAASSNDLDLKAEKPLSFTAVLTAAGWTSSTAPYAWEQTVTIAGILEDDKPSVDLLFNGATAEAISAELESYGNITRMVAGVDSVTAYCVSDVPTVDLQIQLKVVR